MNTDTKYTLIHYRPDDDEYLGCGDYERHHSEIGIEHNLSFEQLRARIIELTKYRRFTSDDYEEPCQFAILSNRVTLAARGEALSLNAPADSEATKQFTAIFDEAGLISEQEKQARYEAKQKEEAAARERAREVAERDQYDRALHTLAGLAGKYAGPRTGNYTTLKERALLDTLKTKFEVEVKP